MYETAVASKQDANKHCYLMLCVICKRKTSAYQVLHNSRPASKPCGWQLVVPSKRLSGAMQTAWLLHSTQAQLPLHEPGAKVARGTRHVHDSLNLTREHISELKYEGKEGPWKFLYGLSVLMKFSQDRNNMLNGLFLWLNVTNLTIQASDGWLKLCFCKF